jgi:hypothetical protein
LALAATCAELKMRLHPHEFAQIFTTVIDATAQLAHLQIYRL